MKIILTAFNGKLKSDIMEVPDEVARMNYFHLPLQQKIGLQEPSGEDMRKIIDLRARFRQYGWARDAKTGCAIYEYELVSVTPEFWEKE